MGALPVGAGRLEMHADCSIKAALASCGKLAAMIELQYPPATPTPRTFFVPPQLTGPQAEEAWQAVRATNPFPSTDRRVQRLQYNNRRGLYVSEVGFLENDEEFEWLTTGIYEPASPAYPWMIAIMRISDGQPKWRNPPVLVSSADVLQVLDFISA
jgi:hypothetical protein